MHRVREVVERIAVVHIPDRGAQEPGPAWVIQLIRDAQFGWLGPLDGRDIDENGVAMLLHAEVFQRLAALHRAFRHGGNPLYGASAVDDHAVIAAADIALVDLAIAERRAAVRAVILDTFDRAGGIAPQHDPLSEQRGAVGFRVLDLNGFRHRIPLALEAVVDPSFDPRTQCCFVCCHFTLSFSFQAP